jgi:hypothetical protein
VITELRRFTALRPTWMRRKPPRRLSRPGSDPDRRAFARRGPCAASALPGCGDCSPWMECCHEGRNGIPIRGIALKVPDSESFGMCSRHHFDWGNHIGPFMGWSRDRQREWANEQAAATHARYLSHGGRRG